MEGDQHSHGLDPVTWEDMLWDRGQFSWEKGWLWGHSAASVAPEWVEETWASFPMTYLLTSDILVFFPVSCSLLRSADQKVANTVKKGLKKLVPKLKQNKNVKGVEALLEKLTS